MALPNVFVNLKITNPIKLAKFSIGKIGFITKEQPLVPYDKTFFKGTTISDIKNYFDNNSTIYAMVEKALLQTPSFMSVEGGEYTIYKMNDVVDATPATATTTTLDIETIKTIKNGVLKIKIDGEIYTLKSIDLTSCNSFNDVAKAIIQKGIVCDVEGTVTGLKFSSKTLGETGEIDFLETTTTSEEVDLYEAFDLENITKENGTNTIGFDLNKFIEDGTINDPEFLFYQFTTDIKLDPDTIKSVYQQMLSLEVSVYKRRLYFYPTITSLATAKVIHKKLGEVDTGYKNRVFLLTSLLSSDKSFLLTSALLSIKSGVDGTKTGSIENTNYNINGKSLNDVDISESEYSLNAQTANELEQAGISYYGYLGDGIDQKLVKVADGQDLDCIANNCEMCEYLKICLTNWIIANRNNLITNENLEATQDYLYGQFDKFLQNKFLTTDKSDDAFLTIQVSNITSCKEKIRSCGCYFEMPTAEQIIGTTPSVNAVFADAIGITSYNVNVQLMGVN